MVGEPGSLGRAQGAPMAQERAGSPGRRLVVLPEPGRAERSRVRQESPRAELVLEVRQGLAPWLQAVESPVSREREREPVDSQGPEPELASAQWEAGSAFPAQRARDSRAQVRRLVRPRELRELRELREPARLQERLAP